MKYTVKISGSGEGMNEALDFTEKTSAALGLTGRETLRLRLLAEEMLGMVRTIAGDISADFGLEHEGKDCRLTLSAKSELDYQKRRELLSASTTGENTARLGIMDKIRGIFEAGIYGMEEGFALQAKSGVGMFGYGMLDATDAGMADAIYAWSMQKYKAEVGAERDDEPDAWDELEKSIIANIADEVSVGVRKDGVELVVHKNFGNG